MKIHYFQRHHAKENVATARKMYFIIFMITLYYNKLSFSSMQLIVA